MQNGLLRSNFSYLNIKLYYYLHPSKKLICDDLLEKTRTALNLSTLYSTVKIKLYDVLFIT